MSDGMLITSGRNVLAFEHEKVVHGKDGFLFLGGSDANGLEEYFAGRSTFSSTAATVWQENTTKRKERFPKLRGLIVPEAHVIYSDKLPDCFPIVSQRPVYEVLNITGEQFLYPQELLKKARQDGMIVYTGNDSHWTEVAALLTWRELRANLGRINEFICHYATSLSHEEQDLRKKVVSEQEAELLERRSFSRMDSTLVFNSEILNKGAVSIHYNANAQKDRLLAFSTSFGLQLTPFWAADFREVLQVYGTGLDWSLIRAWQPDEVIMEMPERFVHAPAIDTDENTTLVTMMARAKLNEDNDQCFTIGRDLSFLSKESQGFILVAERMDRWLSTFLSSGAMQHTAVLEPFGIDKGMIELAMILRARPGLFQVVSGMVRSNGSLYSAFEAVDQQQLRGEHLPYIPHSEMGSLVRVRILLRENKELQASQEIMSHFYRFGASVEVLSFAKYTGLSLPSVSTIKGSDLCLS